MRDDELMDQLLKDAMAADVPELSPAFDARVMRRVRPRRLTPTGRAVIAIYAIAAAVTAVWLMQDLPVVWIAVSVAACAAVAATTSTYARRLTVGA